MTKALKYELRGYTPEQTAVLTSPFKSSKFSQNEDIGQPTVLEIFDFDSTLFMSPYMSPQLWSKTLNSLVLAEGAIGPGWWRDLNSLQLGDAEELQESAWDGYWNEPIVEKAQDSIKDPSKLSVMLTGRRFHPFGQIIPLMLSSKGLDFDIVALRPDPAKLIEDGTKFNGAPSAFVTTMDFKKAFILNILAQVPSIRTILMYDDRKHHVVKFEEWIRYLITKTILDDGCVHFVVGHDRGFDPGRELACMQKIVNEHNRRVELRRANDEPPPSDVEDRFMVENWWCRKAILKPVVSSLNIRFTDEEIAKLTKQVEASVDKNVLQTAKRFPIVGQELTIKSIIPGTSKGDDMAKLGDEGHRIQFEILSVGEVAPDGVAVQARVLGEHIEHLTDEYIYIPLWCRPAFKDKASDGYRQFWKFKAEVPITLSGVLCLGHMYDVEGDPPLEARRDGRRKSYLHHKPYFNHHRHNLNKNKRKGGQLQNNGNRKRHKGKNH